MRLMIWVIILTEHSTALSSLKCSLGKYMIFYKYNRLANSKFKEPGIVPTYAEALDKILRDHVLPKNPPTEWTSFREKELWTLEVNDLLEANLPALKKVFQSYFESGKKYMTLVDSLNMMIRDCPLTLTE